MLLANALLAELSEFFSLKTKSVIPKIKFFQIKGLITSKKSLPVAQSRDGRAWRMAVVGCIEVGIQVHTLGEDVVAAMLGLGTAVAENTMEGHRFLAMEMLAPASMNGGVGLLVVDQRTDMMEEAPVNHSQLPAEPTQETNPPTVPYFPFQTKCADWSMRSSG
jgi:hypothetical protein